MRYLIAFTFAVWGAWLLFTFVPVKTTEVTFQACAKHAPVLRRNANNGGDK